jgi:Gas vesicle synthesis protein GvpL/GvpF
MSSCPATPAACHLVGIGRAADWVAAPTLPLKVVTLGPLAVILVRPASGEVARAHHRHVLACCRRGAFLPARAGQVWGRAHEAIWSDPALAGSAIARLDQVDGAIEITVRLSLPHSAVNTEAADGRSYLRQRQEEMRAGAAAAHRLKLAADRVALSIGERALAVRHETETAADEIIHLIALLVPRGIAAEVVLDIDGAILKAGHGICGRIDGPWPPYSFADLPAAPSTEGLAA